MKRDDFLKELAGHLSYLPPEQVEDIGQFYAEAIADRMEDGMSEDEAVAAMGAPATAAETALSDLPAVPRAIARTRRKSTILLWVLAIVGSPVWVPLLVAFAGIALSIYACIWIVALCVWIVVACLGIVGVSCLALTVVGVVIGNIPYAIAMLGCGVGFIGATFLAGTVAWGITKQLARLSALWAVKAVSPFWKGRKPDTTKLTTRKRMSHLRKTCLATAGCFVVAGIILAGIGFAASGFDPAVFDTSISTDKVVIGGTNIDPNDVAFIEVIGR